MDVDIAIIGGGPAGTTAALALRRALPSASIVILDAATFPRDKACGDAIGPAAVRVYRELGIESELFSGSQRVSVGRVMGPRNIEFTASFPKSSKQISYGYIQPRIDFDDALLKVAADRGITILQGCRVSDAHLEEDCWEISYESASSSATQAISTNRLRASFLIGADGASSQIRKFLQLPTLRGRSRALAIRAYAKILPSGRQLQSGELLVVFEPSLAPIYGWIFPLADGRINIGVGYLEIDKGKGDRNLSRQLQVFVDFLKTRNFNISDITGIEGHPLPLGNNRETFTGTRAILIGDAAGMINPLSGEGISYIARASEILALELGVVGIENIRANNLADAEKKYEARFRSEYSAHFRSNYLATRALSIPWMGKAIFRAAQNSDYVRLHGVALMFGDARFNAKAIALVLRGLVRKDLDDR